jgi:hypothetical protein
LAERLVAAQLEGAQRRRGTTPRVQDAESSERKAKPRKPKPPLDLSFLNPLDRPVTGAKAIAAVLNLRTGKKGKPDARKAFHQLQQGYLDADKVGREWRSTPRRLLFGSTRNAITGLAKKKNDEAAA